MKEIIVTILFALLYISISKLFTFEIGVFTALGIITASLCKIESKLNKKDDN